MIVPSGCAQTRISLDCWSGPPVCPLSYSSGERLFDLYPFTRLHHSILFECVLHIDERVVCAVNIDPPPAILIFHAPKRVEDAFYYQMSTVYAILITCSVSLIQRNITRFHATIAACIASSPVSIYFLVYSIRAFWGEHRLDAVLGKKKYLNRGLVFLAAGIWISIVVYTSPGLAQGRFTQGSCTTVTAQEMFGTEGLINPAAVIIAALAVLSWPVSIVLARKEIWPPGERYRPRFVAVW